MIDMFVSAFLMSMFYIVQIASWKHNCSEVSDLLFQLGKNCDCMESVMRVSKSDSLATVTNIFPDLFEKLVGNLLVEMEDICLQIKVFM